MVTDDNYQGKIPEIPEIDFVALSRGGNGKNSSDAGDDFQSWGIDLENYSSGSHSTPYQPSLSSAQLDTLTIVPGQGNEILGQAFVDACGSHPHGQEEWQVQNESICIYIYNCCLYTYISN